MKLRRSKKRRKGMSTFKAGLIGIVLVAVVSYLAYTKFANPFASKYTIHATFANANGLQPGSLVRIAGVNVGTVTAVSQEPGCKSVSTTQNACQAADVTMNVSNQGLPIHDDATFAIRPRIFLEGNFFVDVSPGTPQAPVASNDHTFPIQQGVEPVQFDQVLTGLQGDTRQNLQALLQQYGKAVKEGGPSFNKSIQYWLPAYEYSSIVAHDALGLQPHDLSNYIAAQGQVAGALDTHPQNLENLITDFNTTANAFARENTSLEQTVAELPKTLGAAIPAFNALNAAFPPLRAFARALVPGVKSTGPMVDASLPFVTQLNDLVQPAELRGLTADLRPTVPALAKLTKDTIPLMKNEVRPAASCVANVIYPWSQLTVPDSNFNASNGFPSRKVYVEAVDYLPGLAGESRDFDANGPYIRILGTGGTLTYSLQPGMFGQALTKLDAVQPEVPPGGKRPPYKETVPCETQQPISNLATPTSGPIQQTNTSSSPASKARWAGANQNALPALAQAASASGLKLNTSDMSGGSAKSGSGSGSGSGAGSGASGTGGGQGGAAGGSGGPLSGAANDVGQAIAGVLKGS
ncbi:MAG TPA: MlaD family protein [Solirubrobacteraceae bacterium]|nr:MlaD family protein [Solirubrobacteraceae bacterium]